MNDSMLARVLVIDDEPAVCDALAIAIRRGGFEADTAYSGAEAIRLARTRFYAVVATDLRMPGMDGLSLIEQLRGILPSAAYLLVSGASDLDLRASVLADNSIASVILKPWDDDELTGAVQRALTLHEKRARTEVPQAAGALEAIALLHLEDNDADAELIGEYLAGQSPPFTLSRVRRLGDALELLHQFNYGVLLADLTLPDARGFDSVTRLQAAAPTTPVVIVSGLEDELLANQVIQLGAQDYLAKRHLSEASLVRAIRFAAERKGAEQRLLRLAHYDQLTGLANRTTLRDRLAQAVVRAKRRGTRLGVMFLDLDGFKQVNDSLGHDVGDALLQEVAKRLRATMRDYDTVARLAGDEFAILVDDLESDGVLSELAERVIREVRVPYNLRGVSVTVTVSVGISVFPDTVHTASDLLRCADEAMYTAKRRGRNAFAFHGVGRGTTPVSNESIAADLNAAFRRREYSLLFQPQVSLHTERLVGFEALLRWTHGDHMMVPAQFLPMLGETGDIVAVGHWALREAVTRLRHWRETLDPDLHIAVNLSARELEQAGLVTRVEEVLATSGLPPGALELEVTERVLAQHSVRHDLALKDVKSLGVRLVVDGFGGGDLSSGLTVSALSRFEIDAVKVARPLVSTAADDPESATAARAVIELGRSLGIQVIADGVESEVQLNFFREEGCDIAQGFFFGRPASDWDDLPVAP